MKDKKKNTYFIVLISCFFLFPNENKKEYDIYNFLEFTLISYWWFIKIIEIYFVQYILKENWPLLFRLHQYRQMSTARVKMDNPPETLIMRTMFSMLTDPADSTALGAESKENKQYIKIL